MSPRGRADGGQHLDRSPLAEDFSYRALYLGDIITTTYGHGRPPAGHIGGHWDHQLRVGLRFNYLVGGYSSETSAGAGTRLALLCVG